MNETVKKIRAMILGMFNQQYKNNAGIDNRINLYMVEVQFIKDVVTAITGDACQETDKFHDYCCDLLDEMHKEFEC